MATSNRNSLKIEDDSLLIGLESIQGQNGQMERIISDDVVAAFKLHTDDGHEDPNVATYYKELFNSEAVSKYVVKLKQKN